MKKHILQLLLLAIPLFAQAQTAIKAKITDSNNNPVAFANIYIPESKKSTLSNESGDFYILINPETDKILLISHLSYETAQIKISSNFPKNIVLKEGSLQLQEVVLGNKLTGYDIALKVVENLKENHDVAPAYYEYFTRVAEYTDNWKEINLIQEYYGKLKHTNSHNTKALIYKSRVVPYNATGEELLKTDSSFDLWAIRGDNILLYKPDYLKKGKLKKYDITIEGSASLNGHECYVLKYYNEEADYSEKSVMAYVDKETYGIVKVITTYNENDNIYMERNFVNINNKWVLSSATEKLHTYKITSTLYNYLTNEDDYADIDFTRTPFWEKLKKFNKDPNDTFWDNYQHIPLPEN